MRDDGSSDRAGMRQLLRENLGVLEQLSGYLHTLSAEHYQQAFGVGGQQATGKHVRHIIDHYEAFLRSLRGEAPHEINYEHRQREAVLENDPDAACQRLEALQGALQEIAFLDGRQALSFVHQGASGTVQVGSSLGRELIFLSSHTVHHMAIIALLAERMGKSLPQDFGVHPSTLRFWQQQQSRMAKVS